MKPRICVFGSSNTDLVIKVPHLPLPGETVLGGEFSIVQGGKGANQAVAAARAGGDVVFIACVGNDQFGLNAINELNKEGIDISHIKIIDHISSGMALINVAESGENSISVAPGANSHLLPEDITKIEGVVRTSQIVLVQLEIPLNTVKSIILMSRKYNIPVILNPAPARTLDSEILQSVDIITPNEKEAALIVNSGSQEIRISELNKKLKEMGLKTIVITLGAKGAFYSVNNLSKFIDGFKVQAVDTTAAGDVFNGYLAVFLALGKSLDESIKMANKAASISVTRMGAQPSIPYINEVGYL